MVLSRQLLSTGDLGEGEYLADAHDTYWRRSGRVRGLAIGKLHIPLLFFPLLTSRALQPPGGPRTGKRGSTGTTGQYAALFRGGACMPVAVRRQSREGRPIQPCPYFRCPTSDP
jgi:hypothetical protein